MSERFIDACHETAEWLRQEIRKDKLRKTAQADDKDAPQSPGIPPGDPSNVKIR
jgi:hypothetical protein